ncbi:myb domain protein 121 [Raphanus sativus]|nr:myb domain protein 121 [Raphanus sativus]
MEISFSNQEKVKRSRKKLELKPQPQLQNQPSQLVSQDNELNIATSFSYPTSVYNDQFHMPQNVAATSIDHSMIDEGNLWSLEYDDPHRFGGGSEQRTAANIVGKLNGGGNEAPSCGSWDYSYKEFYTGGYKF